MRVCQRLWPIIQCIQKLERALKQLDAVMIDFCYGIHRKIAVINGKWHRNE